MRKFLSGVKTKLAGRNYAEYFLLAIPVWIFILVMRIFLFYAKGKTDYMNISDNIIYPVLASGIYLIILFLLDVKTEFRTGRFRKFLTVQTYILFVYAFYFVTNLKIPFLIIIHLIIALGIVFHEISRLLNPKFLKIYYLTILVLGVLFLLFHNTSVFNKYSIDNTGYFTEAYSESLSYNTAVYYYDNPQDIKKYFLLPIIDFPGNPFQFKANADLTGTLVYTHYPAGANTILYVLVSIQGKDSTLTLDMYRMFPFIIYLFGFIFLVKYFKVLSGNSIFSIVISLIIFMVPAIDRFKFSLYYYSYAFSLLFIFLYFIARYLSVRKKKYLAGIFMIGFLQFWFSFDLLPLTFFLACSTIFLPFYKSFGKINKSNILPGIVTIFSMVIGAATRILHNNLYFKSLGATLKDMIEAFIWRSSGVLESFPPDKFYIDQIFKTYNNEYLYNTEYFGFPLLLIALVAAVALTILLSQYKQLGEKANANLKNFLKSLTIFLWLAIFTSIFWIYTMRNHSAIHPWVISRQFIFLVIALFSVFTIVIFKNGKKIFNQK